MTHHMHSSIRSLEAEGELSPDWCWFLKQLFGLTIDGSTDTWTRGEEPQWTQWAQQQPIHADAKRDIQSWVRNGSECNWKGLFPPRLSMTLQHMGMTSKRAQKWVKQVRDILLDGATTIWRLRCRECNDEGELPISEVTAHLRDRAIELWRNIEQDTPVEAREYKAVTTDQIREIHPHKLRALVRTLEQQAAARHLPTITLRLTRPCVEINPLATLDTDTLNADTDTQRRMHLSLSCSAILSVTTQRTGLRRQPYIQLSRSESTKVSLTDVYKYAFDIHRQMGLQRVNSRPVFSNSNSSNDIRDRLQTATRRYLSTAHRLELHAHTGVPAQEYDITLPCGIRRKAMPYRNGLRPETIGTTQRPWRARDERVVRQRRNLALAKQQREREAVDRAQRTKQKKRRTKGGGVRANMERAGVIKKHKRQWQAMCLSNDTAGSSSNGGGGTGGGPQHKGAGPPPSPPSHMEDQAVGRTGNRGNEGGGTGGGTQHKGAGPSPSPQPTHGGHQTAEGSNTTQSAPGGQQQHSGAGRKPPPNSTHPVGDSGTRRGGGEGAGQGEGGAKTQRWERRWQQQHHGQRPWQLDTRTEVGELLLQTASQEGW